MRSLLENSSGGALGERVQHERSRAFRVSVQRQRRTHDARGGLSLVALPFGPASVSFSPRVHITLPVDARFVSLIETTQRFLVEQRRASNFNVHICAVISERRSEVGPFYLVGARPKNPSGATVSFTSLADADLSEKLW